MRNIVFVIWIIVWDLLFTLNNHLCLLYEHAHSTYAELVVGTLYFIVWVAIAKLLYEPKDEN